MPEFIKMERSYLEWAGNKITELNAEVRELKIRLEKSEIENKNYREIYYSEHCPHCNKATYPIMINVNFACPKCGKSIDWKPTWARKDK